MIGSSNKSYRLRIRAVHVIMIVNLPFRWLTNQFTALNVTYNTLHECQQLFCFDPQNLNQSCLNFLYYFARSSKEKCYDIQKSRFEI